MAECNQSFLIKFRGNSEALRRQENQDRSFQQIWRPEHSSDYGTTLWSLHPLESAPSGVSTVWSPHPLESGVFTLWGLHLREPQLSEVFTLWRLGVFACCSLHPGSLNSLESPLLGVSTLWSLRSLESPLQGVSTL